MCSNYNYNQCVGGRPFKITRCLNRAGSDCYYTQCLGVAFLNISNSMNIIGSDCNYNSCVQWEGGHFQYPTSLTEQSLTAIISGEQEGGGHFKCGIL